MCYPNAVKFRQKPFLYAVGMPLCALPCVLYSTKAKKVLPYAIRCTNGTGLKICTHKFLSLRSGAEKALKFPALL